MSNNIFDEFQTAAKTRLVLTFIAFQEHHQLPDRFQLGLADRKAIHLHRQTLEDLPLDLFCATIKGAFSDPKHVIAHCEDSKALFDPAKLDPRWQHLTHIPLKERVAFCDIAEADMQQIHAHQLFDQWIDMEKNLGKKQGKNAVNPKNPHAVFWGTLANAARIICAKKLSPDEHTLNFYTAYGDWCERMGKSSPISLDEVIKVRELLKSMHDARKPHAAPQRHTPAPSAQSRETSSKVAATEGARERSIK